MYWGIITTHTHYHTLTSYQSLSLAISHYHLLSVTITRYQSLLLTISHYHSLSVTIARYQSLSLAISHYHSLSVTITCYRSLSLAISHYHLLSVTIAHYQQNDSDIQIQMILLGCWDIVQLYCAAIDKSERWSSFIGFSKYLYNRTCHKFPQCYQMHHFIQNHPHILMISIFHITEIFPNSAKSPYWRVKDVNSG